MINAENDLEKLIKLASSDPEKAVVILRSTGDCKVIVDGKKTYTLSKDKGIKIFVDEGQHSFMFKSSEDDSITKTYREKCFSSKDVRIICDMKWLVKEKKQAAEKEKEDASKAKALKRDKTSGFWVIIAWTITAMLFVLRLAITGEFMSLFAKIFLGISVVGTLAIATLHSIDYTRFFWNKKGGKDFLLSLLAIGINILVVLFVFFLIKLVFKAAWCVIAMRICWGILAILFFAAAVYGIMYVIKEH